MSDAATTAATSLAARKHEFSRSFGELAELISVLGGEGDNQAVRIDSATIPPALKSELHRLRGIRNRIAHEGEADNAPVRDAELGHAEQALARARRELEELASHAGELLSERQAKEAEARAFRDEQARREREEQEREEQEEKAHQARLRAAAAAKRAREAEQARAAQGERARAEKDPPMQIAAMIIIVLGMLALAWQLSIHLQAR